MHVYADADALPTPIKEILFRAAQRLRMGLTLVANKTLAVPESEFISALRVGQGFDVVDAAIAERVAPGDLVVTADIPLAAQVIAKDAHALSPRGEVFSKDNIQGRLAMRNLLSELRDGGVVTGGPAPLNRRDIESFANQFNQMANRLRNG
ncbi:MAG: YaiI/YqxD family protein [Thermodesulfobacteriota bacterium]